MNNEKILVSGDVRDTCYKNQYRLSIVDNTGSGFTTPWMTEATFRKLQAHLDTVIKMTLGHTDRQQRSVTVNKDKSYLQMLREILAVKRRIQISEDSGDYSIGLQFPNSGGGTYFSDGRKADTLEHSIEKAWMELCSQQ